MKYITAQQYKTIKDIPRGRLTARYLVYTGAVITNKTQILLCKPKESKYKGWQLPGGKVLWSETFTQCIKREVLEETGLAITIGNIVGIYQRETTPEDEEFIRIIYSVKDYKTKNNKPIDPEIKEVKWFEIEDIFNGKIELQSQQIKEELKDYQNKLYPANLVRMYKW